MESIFVISDNKLIGSSILEYLKDLGKFDATILASTEKLIGRIYNAPPSLLIMDNGISLKNYVKIIRDDPIFNHLPIIILLEKGEFIDRWNDYPVDDFIFKPIDKNNFLMRVALSIRRVHRIVEINPLTMLPGNTPIIKEVQNRLDNSMQFALAYADLDNFKPYNDRYGFTRGDEIIRMTGRLITNIVKSHDPEHGFVGHIGGDDFVFMVAPEKVGIISDEIVRNFDKIILSFYDVEDIERGHIVSHTRNGKKEIFSILTISIGITINRKWFHHYGEMSSAVTKIKVHAKDYKGSIYCIDRRNYQKLS